LTRAVPILAIIAALAASPLAAETILVDANGFGEYRTIQEGINAAADGDTIIIVAAPYRGLGNRDLDLESKNLVFQGVAFHPWQRPVIDCEGAGRAFSLTAANDSTTIIDAIEFTGGDAETGGAIDCWGASPIIRNCSFYENLATIGGAIFVSGAEAGSRSGDASIRDCDFSSNRSVVAGGAIAAVSANIAVKGCSFYANRTGDGDGGALHVAASSPVISRCTFAGNSGTGAGAIALDGSSGTIERCVIAFSTNGRGVAGGSPEIFHCCVSGNDDGDALPGNDHDNLFTDPLLCDLAAGILSLCDNSPCLPGGNGWEITIGSEAQGCADCSSPAESASWSAIKALFLPASP